jgi:hypothetical protein
VNTSSLPFVVPSVSAAVGMDRFFGTLTVLPGSIVFDPTSQLNKVMRANSIRRVVHTDRDVAIVRARLLPPWLNSPLILHGDPAHGEDASVGVQMAALTRRDLSGALGAAGFRVRERATWFSMGGSGARG